MILKRVRNLKIRRRHSCRYNYRVNMCGDERYDPNNTNNVVHVLRSIFMCIRKKVLFSFEKFKSVLDIANEQKDVRNINNGLNFRLV